MRIVQYCTWVVPSHHCWYTFSSICRLRNSWICHKYFISSVFVCVHLVADAGSCLNKRTYVGTEVSQTLIKQVHNSADECMCIPNPNSNPPPRECVWAPVRWREEVASVGSVQFEGCRVNGFEVKEEETQSVSGSWDKPSNERWKLNHHRCEVCQAHAQKLVTFSWPRRDFSFSVLLYFINKTASDFPCKV